MKDKCVAVLGRAQSLNYSGADFAGVDKGALTLAENGIRMRTAIGDFDSVSDTDLELIEAYADEVIRLNPVKDDSDSEAAVKYLLDKGYQQIILAGALGGRIDHETVNIALVCHYPQRVFIEDVQNRISAFKEGTYRIYASDFQYVSFFPVGECVVSLERMKYPLDHKKMSRKDLIGLGLSNEISGGYGILTVHEGEVLVICSKD